TPEQNVYGPIDNRATRAIAARASPGRPEKSTAATPARTVVVSTDMGKRIGPNRPFNRSAPHPAARHETAPAKGKRKLHSPASSGGSTTTVPRYGGVQWLNVSRTGVSPVFMTQTSQNRGSARSGPSNRLSRTGPSRGSSGGAGGSGRPRSRGRSVSSTPP